MNPTIYVIGSSNMDLITTSDRIPQAGETITGNAFFTRCGGKGCNQAVAVAKLCADPSKMHFLSCIGDDPNGHELMKHMKANHVCVDAVQILPSASTGTASICIDAAGENSIIVVGGANAQFSSQLFDSIPIASSCRVAVLQEEIPIPTIRHILSVCKQRGIVTILNPAPASPELTLEDPSLDCVDVLIPNETESQLITGVGNGESFEAMMDIMAAKHPSQIVIMTCGKKGALIGRGQERFAVSCPSVKVRDTVGAGDCFVGTFAYLLDSSLADRRLSEIPLAAIKEMVQKSCYASSYSVQFKGGFDKYPSSIIDTWDESRLVD